MKVALTGARIYGALIILLSAWMLHGFLHALLAAGVTAIASWPLYRRFAARFPWRTARTVTALAFTCVMTLFVLAPLAFAFGALLIEAQALLRELAFADSQGIAVPNWLDGVPLVGPWVADRWQSGLANPGALSTWLHAADPKVLLKWAQALGLFMGRQFLIVGFTVLVLFFLYHEGESLAKELAGALRRTIGPHAQAYVELAIGAVRASVNSMLVVGLFDGFATGAIYAIAGASHPGLWASITGVLALVPFLGYVAVVTLTLQLTMTGTANAAVACLGLGSFALLCGDKVVRPMVGRGETRLPFVWVLMGCLGGFECLGPEGLVIGPVVLTLARELWSQRRRG